jgi:hypothetical protein
MLYVGVPVAELIRYNAVRGELGPGDPDEQVARRLAHMRRGTRHEIERHRRDGTVIKIVGGPMPASNGGGAGYVMSFTDITGEASARAELRQTLAQLESRVAARGRCPRRTGNWRAPRPTRRAFWRRPAMTCCSPCTRRGCSPPRWPAMDERVRGLVGSVDSAILAAEALLRALLDISKLDAGGVTPKPEPLALGAFLRGVVDGFAPMAQGKGCACGWARWAARWRRTRDCCAR